jgi:hypothetical protein
LREHNLPYQSEVSRGHDLGNLAVGGDFTLGKKRDHAAGPRSFPRWVGRDRYERAEVRYDELALMLLNEI